MHRSRFITLTALLVCFGGTAPVFAAEGGNAVVEVGAKLLNFAVLVGALVYFLRAPIAGYLSSRSSQIRQDLVTAAEMRAAATAQLAEIDKRMQELPAELEALKRQGAEDVKAEQARITQSAAEERARLLEQTRREIDMRMRIARRELTEHAAVLAVDVAESRIRRTITPDDQMRLVDRYATQLAAPAGAAARATR
jgi:F-type H+-transporting ATPase subunit b